MTDPGLTNDCFSRDALEFPGILELVRGFLSGPISDPLLRGLKPSTDLESIRKEHELTKEARECLREGSRPSLGSLKDSRPVLDKLGIEGESCTALEILTLVEIARAGRDLRGMFSKTPFTRLDALADGIADYTVYVRGRDATVSLLRNASGFSQDPVDAGSRLGRGEHDVRPGQVWSLSAKRVQPVIGRLLVLGDRIPLVEHEHEALARI